jgi:hypothetical protein
MKIIIIIVAGVLLVISYFVYVALTSNSKIDEEIDKEAKLILQKIEEGSFDSIALHEYCLKNPEMRRHLYFYLRDKSNFPEFFVKEAYSAETDLVLWLMHPHELGSKPETIELIDSIFIESDSAKLKYFLFKFKAKPDSWAYSNGWMAGIAGPFLSETPLYESTGFTFSELEPISSRSNEEHVLHLHKIVSNDKNVLKIIRTEAVNPSNKD